MLKSYVRNLFILICLSFTFFSCTVSNLTRVWQPWTRTFKSYDKSIPVKSTIVLSIAGETKPLLGSESLLQDNIRNTLTDLFERRGYVVNKDSGQFNVKFNYKTERHDIINNTLETQTYLSNTTSTEPKEKSTLGIILAGLVALTSASSTSSSSSETYVQSSSQSIESYNHAISIEIYNKNKDLVFKGESAWDSKTQDIEGDLKTAAQIILCSLPSDPETYPHVAEVLESKEENYFTLKCKDSWFSCPALPYKIEFYQNYNYIKVFVTDPYAFEAYTDLILTADNALPKGDDDYSNPLDPGLWKSAQLGGRYYIGKSNVPKNILINLDTDDSGYKVTRCRIVSDEEYAGYEYNLKKWKEATEEYYKIYQ